MALGVLMADVVHVASGHHRAAGLLGQRRQVLVDAALAINARVLQLEVHVVLPEDAGERVQLLAGTVEVVVDQAGADGSRQAARQHDDALGVAAHQLMVNTRAAVIPLEVPGRTQADEVVVAGGVLGQQREVVALLLAAEPVVGHHVGLKPHDGRDAALGGLAVQLHRATHHPMIGERDRALPQLLNAIKQAGDLARAIEDRVIRVDVQMCKGWTGAHPLKPTPSPRRRPMGHHPVPDTAWCQTPGGVWHRFSARRFLLGPAGGVSPSCGPRRSGAPCGSAG